MNRRLLSLLLPVLVLFVLSGCGLLREPEAPSAPLEAIPLDSTQPAPEVQSTATAEPVISTPETEMEDEAPVEDTAVEDTAVEDTPAEAESEPPAEAEPTVAPAAQVQRYQIVQDESEVRFELDEDLRGVRTTVVGATNQVAGEIAVDLNDLSTAQVGVIQVNARTLATDNNFRNRAIQNEILDTGAFELITFTPTAVTGLTGAGTPGEEVTFSLEGDLTIRDVTLPAVFEVTATPVSETELRGLARTVVDRTAYGLAIPTVPNVANVEEEVELIIDFVARG